MKTNEIKAVLLGLRLKSFPNEKADPKITKAVEESRKLDPTWGEARKYKLDPECLEPVLGVHRKIRTWTYGMTLKWESGRQLLPANKFEEYTQEFEVWQEQAKEKVNEFLANYAGFVADRAEKLNGDFDPSDYPEDPSKFFSCEYLLYPLPDEAHITAKYGKAIAQAMKASVAKANEDRIEEAMADLWTRILKPVQHVVTKLSENKPLFRDSLIANVNEMLEEAPQFDFLKSPEVAAAFTQIRDQIASANTETLRSDVGERNDVLKAAKKIVAKFGTQNGRKLNLTA